MSPHRDDVINTAREMFVRMTPSLVHGMEPDAVADFCLKSARVFEAMAEAMEDEPRGPLPEPTSGVVR